MSPSSPGVQSRSRRYLGNGRLTVAGTQTLFERWEYRDYPELVEIRFRLPGVSLRVEGWNLTGEEVRALAAQLERLELGSDLLRRTTDAADAATRAWESWNREQRGREP